MHARGVDDQRHQYDLWLTCDDCGDVFVHAELCWLRQRHRHGEHVLNYPCPKCQRKHTMVVPDDEVVALRRVGFRVFSGVHPSELGARPALSWDDVTAFRSDLGSVETVDDLFAS
jgi:hypothetical protein